MISGWTAEPSTSCALWKPGRPSLPTAPSACSGRSTRLPRRGPALSRSPPSSRPTADEEEHCSAEITAAGAAVRHRQDEVAAAEREAAAARDDEERSRAERAVARAADHLSVAGLRLERADADLEHLKRLAVELRHELPELEARAAAIARAEDLRWPGREPQELVDWASQARAELFVAAGQASAERERVVREGNELASMLLAEPTYGLTVAQALRQVEAASRRVSAGGSE